MTTADDLLPAQFDWHPEPRAAALIKRLLDDISHRSPAVAQLAQRMAAETGTRLIDWVDHLAVKSNSLATELADVGFVKHNVAGEDCWQHPRGMFPTVRLHALPASVVAVKVESVADFLAANRISNATIEGAPNTQLRRAKIAAENMTQFWVVERHGSRAWAPEHVDPAVSRAAQEQLETFRRRRRKFSTDEEGFAQAWSLIKAATKILGRDWTCDLFFQAEREYWERRNRAGQTQKARQDRLGLGWANHDHHTYRSSRENFTRLVKSLELLGFESRERFYGGHGAGWGAQVLSQPVCGITIFADVDMTPEELSGDFAHEVLPPRNQLGTVGLWCKLHGEAFLQAGMHHLECQFDFDAVSEQLATEGVGSMPPFTNFEYLRQAFTAGEIWPVDPHRLEIALSEGFITAEQAEQFRLHGAVGSHLEILQREQGYKGFNQTGISEIIKATDPRHLQPA